jgi:hypothetical protein
MILGGSLAALVAAEGLLRLEEPLFHMVARMHNTGEYIMVPSPIWHHWPRPRAMMSFMLEDPTRYPAPVIYSTTSYGCRYLREVAIPKPAGVTRIIVMGDSFTEGYYYKDTIAAILEQRLNLSSPERRFEVLNCGCTSYSPLVEYLRLKHQLVSLEPDAVILNIDLTDVFDDNWIYRPRTRFSSDGEPIAVPGAGGYLRRFLIWARFHFLVMRVLSEGRAQLLTALEDHGRAHPRNAYTFENVFAYYSTMPSSSGEWQVEVGFFLKDVSRIINFCRRRGIALTITMYPYKQQLEHGPGRRRWNREVEHRVKHLCDEDGVDFFSAYDSISQAYAAGQPIYWDDDIHFTPVGQRIWATSVTDYYTARIGRPPTRVRTPEEPPAALPGNAPPANSSRAR